LAEAERAWHRVVPCPTVRRQQPRSSSRWQRGLLDLPRAGRRVEFAHAAQFPSHQPLKGRGAASNPTGRFDALSVEKMHDGLPGTKRPTAWRETSCRIAPRIISTNDSPDVGFEQFHQSVRGCTTAALCFARRAMRFSALARARFRDQLFYKADAVQLLEAELAKPKYTCKPIALGINTDGYSRSRKTRVTRSILAVLSRAAGIPWTCHEKCARAAGPGSASRTSPRIDWCR